MLSQEQDHQIKRDTLDLEVKKQERDTQSWRKLTAFNFNK